MDQIGKGLNATPKTKFGVYSVGREGNLDDLQQDITNEIGFREMTLVTVWRIEQKGRCRKQGDRSVKFWGLGWKAGFKRNFRN